VTEEPRQFPEVRVSPRGYNGAEVALAVRFPGRNHWELIRRNNRTRYVSPTSSLHQEISDQWQRLVDALSPEPLQANSGILAWCAEQETSTREWLARHNPACECEVGPTTLDLLDEIRALLGGAPAVQDLHRDSTRPRGGHQPDHVIVDDAPVAGRTLALPAPSEALAAANAAIRDEVGQQMRQHAERFEASLNQVPYGGTVKPAADGLPVPCCRYGIEYCSSDHPETHATPHAVPTHVVPAGINAGARVEISQDHGIRAFSQAGEGIAPGRCCIGPFADGTHAPGCLDACQDCGGDVAGPRRCHCRDAGKGAPQGEGTPSCRFGVEGCDREHKFVDQNPHETWSYLGRGG
jgi:hypothetical protein